MAIQLKRVYEQPESTDGTRILVERLWPRGLSKEKAKVDIWLKELAPSTELRKWFDHDASKWEEFKKRYYAELKKHPDMLETILNLAENECITFVFAAKEEEFNNAVALKKCVENLLTKRP